MINRVITPSVLNVQNSVLSKNVLTASILTTASLTAKFDNYYPTTSIADYDYFYTGLPRTIGGIGRGWASPFSVATTYLSPISFDNFEGYTINTILDQSGSRIDGWSASYSAIENYKKLVAYDTFETYQTQSVLDGLSGGAGWSSNTVYRSPLSASVIISSPPSSSAGYVTQDLRLEMSNSYFARTFRIGNNWTRIRIACSLSTPISASAGFAATTIFVGVSAGTSSVLGDASPANVVGTMMSGTLAANVYTNANYPPGGISYQWRVVGWKQSGSLSQKAGAGLCRFFYTNDTSGSVRPIYFTDIFKSGNIVSASVFASNISIPTATTDFLDGGAISMAEEIDVLPPVITNYNYTNLLALDNLNEGVNGNLDSINISVSGSIKVWFSDISVVRLL